MNKYFLLLVVVIFSFGCKKTLYPSANGNTKKFTVDNLDFEYLSSKSKVKYISGDKKLSSTVQTRIRKDSIIWISAIPALGLEAARILITQDSLLLINRLTKEYYAYTYDQLTAAYNMPLNFSIIESLFTGNLKLDTENMKVKKKGSEYLAYEKREALNIQNHINRSSAKLEKRNIEDTASGKTLEINYSDFKEISGQLVPGLITLLLKESDTVGVKGSVTINNQRMSVDEKLLKFPFTISPKYERKH